MINFSFSIHRELLSSHVQACVRCYTSNWKVVRYNYRYLSSSVGCKAIQTKLQSTSVKQEFEVDFQGTITDNTSELGKKLITTVYFCLFLQYFFLDATSIPSSRQSVASLGSISSCGDTLTPRNSWASLDLRHSAGDPLIPEILEHAAPEVQDQLNDTRRQTERQDALFSLCPNQNDEILETVERRLPASAPAEHLGHRILVKCLELT